MALRPQSASTFRSDDAPALRSSDATSQRSDATATAHETGGARDAPTRDASTRDAPTQVTAPQGAGFARPGEKGFAQPGEEGFAQPDEMGFAQPDKMGFAHAGRPEASQASVSFQASPPVSEAPFERVAASGLTAARLLRGMVGSDTCLAYQDTNLVYRWIVNAPDGFEDIADRQDADILPSDAADLMVQTKRRCLQTGQSASAHLRLKIGPRARWFDCWIQPDTDGDDVLGLFVVAVEVTERVEREDRLRVLLREVSHRSRNLLAIVQAIASQTVRTTSTASRFVSRFNERLQSLAHTLDLVTVREWEGATVHQLVSRQAGPFVSRTGAMELSGPDPVLTPNAALHLGLAVQELASNAAAHGAWTRPGGTVRAVTRFENDDLIFEWHEAGGEAQDPAEGRGSFGSRTLVSIVPNALGGRATMHYENGTYRYRLSVPAENFDA